MTEVEQKPDRNVQVALTLVSAGYMAEGMSPAQKLQVMSKALNVQGLPTAGRWKIVWGPAEGREFDQWFIAEGPDADGAPTLALVIRGTQMHQWASIRHDLEIGMAPMPFQYPGAASTVSIAKGFVDSFENLVAATSDSRTALGYLQSRLGPGPGPEQVHVIGHSLGGALAPLVGLWVSANFPRRGNSIKVFPFGGQSTGNWAFAKLYQSVFPNQPSRWITDRDLTPLMYAQLDAVERYWSNGPTCPEEVRDLIDGTRQWWEKFSAIPDPHVFHAQGYLYMGDDLASWNAQSRAQHEHRYYLYLSGVYQAPIREAFGRWFPPPGQP